MTEFRSRQRLERLTARCLAAGATGLVWLLFLPALACCQEPEITQANRSAWRDHILPAEPELRWQQIPWLTSYAEGILAAHRADKPLLLWTMNGHPLGCT